MTAQDLQPGGYTITERLFNFIDDLSTDMQFNLYKQLVADQVGIQLFKLIIDMSDEEKIQFLEKLGEGPFEEEPNKTINLDENESFMRKNSRKNCLVAVKYKVGDTSFTGYIINISVNGVFIESNDRFPVGQRIRMAFKLPNATNPLEFKGQINRSGRRGIGVNFLSLNQAQQEIIRAYIANNHPSRRSRNQIED
jgi:Tfp pilus assembly protein PilZ